ncbi:MAG: winged helix-turn-helix transcriptional regulator [Alphaproteobacteria bacterium]|jgi:DNA-binding MarR family transcriptional regulator|nr:winged helix-turn-helix transcriptional regulator [Alphaproteobacteria bacterium]
MTKTVHSRSGSGKHIVLEKFVPYRMSILTNRISGAIARDYEDRFGLRVPEWRCMAVLGRFGANTATGICQRTAMDKVTVSRATTSLLKKNLISRKTDPEDRRRTILNMTTIGRRIHDQIVPIALAHEQQLLEGLEPSEVAQLDHLLAKLEQHLDEA